MKKILIPVLAVSALAAAAPAMAAPWQNINQRQANLDRRIDTGVRNGQITRTEAQRLRGEFRQIANLEYRYRRTGGGLEAWERRDLDRRFDTLSAKIKYERRDRDNYNQPRPGDRDGDGRPDRNDRFPNDPRRW